MVIIRACGALVPSSILGYGPLNLFLLLIMVMKDNCQEYTALYLFLRDADFNLLRCSKCRTLYWITLDNCPECGKPYPSTMEDRRQTMINLFRKYEKTAKQLRSCYDPYSFS